MRVAYLVGRYPAVSHTFISREIDGLRARGMEVHPFSIRRPRAEHLLTVADRRAAAETSVILPPPPGELAMAHGRALAHAPLRYAATLALALRLSAGGVRNGLWQLFYFAEAILLWDRCRARGITHVHAHFANVATAVALLAAHFGGRAWSWSFTMHGPTEFDDVTRFGLAEKVRRAAFVACISDYCRSQLMKLVGDEHWAKLEIVRCGIDPSVYRWVDRSGHDGHLRVLCVGRLVPDKGQGLLLDALADLRRTGRDIHATFVGDGPDRPALERRARRLGLANAVVFTGPVGQDAIGDLYAAADIFCLPSLAEGVPVVLMEAMATGLPVVTSRVMGIPELVEDGASGALVSPGRAEALADVIGRLAEDAELRARWGDTGRERVIAEYDVGRSTSQLHDLYARYLDSSNRGSRAARRRRALSASNNTRGRNGNP